MGRQATRPAGLPHCLKFDHGDPGGQTLNYSLDF